MKKFNFSLFFIGLIFFNSLLLYSPSPVNGWNEDYSPEKLSTQRTICLKNLNQKESALEIRSIESDEFCAEDEEKFRLLIGKEPKGSFALIPILSKKDLYSYQNPLSGAAQKTNSSIWRFTCLKENLIEILGVTTKKFKYQGEVATPLSNQSCESAFNTAKKICLNQLKGDEIFERCESTPESTEL